MTIRRCNGMKNAFNQLTPAQAERLAILLEELGEMQQAIGKILRHGYTSRNPDVLDGPTNRESLERELGDVAAAMGLLFEANDLDEQTVTNRVLVKALKIKPYLHHQA